MKTEQETIAAVFHNLSTEMMTAKIMAENSIRQRSREKVRETLLDAADWMSSARAVMKFTGEKLGVFTTENLQAMNIDMDDLKIAADSLRKARKLVKRALGDEGNDMRKMKSTARSIVFQLDAGIGFAEAVARRARKAAQRDGNPKMKCSTKKLLLQ